MSRATHDIVILQNAAFNLYITRKDTQTPPQPVDLTGWSGEFVIRRSIEAGAALLRATSFTFGSADRNVQLEVTATETAALPTSNQLQEDWVYEVRIWDPLDEDGTSERLLEGRVTVYPSVSRADA